MTYSGLTQLENGGSFHSYVAVYQRVTFWNRQLVTEIFKCRNPDLHGLCLVIATYSYYFSQKPYLNQARKNSTPQARCCLLPTKGCFNLILAVAWKWT